LRFFETKRCIVREFKEEDLSIVLEYRNNLEWMKHQGFKNLSIEEFRFSLIAPYNIDDGSQLAIVSKELNQLIGDLYVKKTKNIINIGYTIHPVHARKGYIKEVVSDLISYLYTIYPECSIQGEMDLDNIASMKLLIALGFDCIEENKDGYTYSLKNRN